DWKMISLLRVMMIGAGLRANCRRAKRVCRAGTLALVLVFATSAVRSSAADPTALDDANAGSPAGEPQTVLVELTEPPSAVAFKATKNASASAALQRDRVRKAMLAVDQQNRLARGMSAKAPVSAIEREYGVVFNGFAVKLLPESIKWLKSQPDVR